MTLNLQISEQLFILENVWRPVAYITCAYWIENVCILCKRCIVNSESRYLYIILLQLLLVFLYSSFSYMFSKFCCCCFFFSPDKSRKFYARENLQTCLYISMELWLQKNIHIKHSPKTQAFTKTLQSKFYGHEYLPVSLDYLLISQIWSVCCQNKHAKVCAKE